MRRKLLRLRSRSSSIDLRLRSKLTGTTCQNSKRSNPTTIWAILTIWVQKIRISVKIPLLWPVFHSRINRWHFLKIKMSIKAWVRVFWRRRTSRAKQRRAATSASKHLGNTTTKTKIAIIRIRIRLNTLLKGQITTSNPSKIRLIRLYWSTKCRNLRIRCCFSRVHRIWIGVARVSSTSCKTSRSVSPPTMIKLWKNHYARLTRACRTWTLCKLRNFLCHSSKTGRLLSLTPKKLLTNWRCTKCQMTRRWSSIISRAHRILTSATSFHQVNTCSNLRISWKNRNSERSNSRQLNAISTQFRNMISTQQLKWHGKRVTKRTQIWSAELAKLLSPNRPKWTIHKLNG